MRNRPLTLTAELIAKTCDGRLISGSPWTVAEGVCTDTRTLRPGQAFFALVGRNHQDNLRLLQDAPPDSTMLELRDRPGPMACVVGRPSAEDLEVAKRLVVRYSRFRDLPAREVRTGTVAEARAWQLERAEHQEGP